MIGYRFISYAVLNSSHAYSTLDNDKTDRLKMLLPKREVNIRRRNLLTRLLDPPSRLTRSTEVHTDIRPHRALQSTHIRAVHNTLTHPRQQAVEVGTPKVRASLQLGERIDVRADTVQHDVLRGIRVEALRKVGVDAQELGAGGTRNGSSLGGLCLERGQQSLEPLKASGVLADPDELDAAQALGRVWAVAEMPDVLEDGSPGGDADTCADEDGDFVVEDVFRGSTVGAVNAELRHLLSVLESDFVHAVGVDAIVELGLGGTGTEGVSEGAGEVTDLADVDGDVGVEWAGGDGKGMPLLAGY
jgi:hypothetical protein